MAGPYLPIRAISRSQAVRIGGVKISPTVTTYVDISGEQTNTPRAYPAVKELRSHLAVGAVIVVGGITSTPSDEVVTQGLVTSATKAAEPEVSTTAGEIRNRATGVSVASAGFTAAKKKVAAAGKERIDIITIHEVTGVSTYTAGTAGVEKAAVAPAVPAENLLVATVTFTETAEVATVKNVNRA